MKIIKTIVYISTIVMIACNNPSDFSSSSIKDKYEKLDSVLFKSKNSVTSIGKANQQSDSAISKKVEKTVKKIEVLHNEVVVLKKENNELKAKLGDTVVRVNKPFNLLPVSQSDNSKPGTSDE
jgi:seryl-tRNA synthetase